MGTVKALDLALTVAFVDADEALRIGMVNRVYDDAELLDRTWEFAQRLRGTPPVAASVVKRTVLQSAAIDLRTSLDLVSSHMAVVQSTEGYQEAQRAFA